jgi:outer membrane protein
MLDLGVTFKVAFEPLVALSYSESEDAVARRALLRRPSLLEAEQYLNAAVSSVAAARGEYLPSANLTAQSYNGTSSPYLGHGGGQVQFAATLPIIDGGSRSAALARARGELDRATALRDQLRAEVQRDVADAYRELSAAQRNLATAQAVQNDAEEQLRISRIRERAGKSIDLEVLDSLSLAANARETVLRSLARYDIAVAAVHHAAGDTFL